ncbi:MAG TPA: glycosyltransferase family 87 protein [Beijerinckiaceae bacterium]
MASAELQSHTSPAPRSSALLKVLSDPLVLFPVAALLVSWPLLVRYYWPAGGGLDVTGHQIGRDFINVWAAPQLAFSGRLSTLFDLDGYADAIGALFGASLPFHNWGYPPFTLLMFWPFAQLPYFWALALWTATFFAAFAGVALSQVEPGRRVLALVALALAPACLVNGIGGQNGFLTAALLLGGLLCLDRRPVLAGVLFGFLTLKPHLGLVLPFVLLALKAWRTIAAATLTALALVAMSVAAFGLEPWREYLGATSAYQMGLLEKWRGFYTLMMPSVFAGVRGLGLSSAIAWTAQAAVALPVLAATVWAVRRTGDPRRRALVVVAAVPLLTPYAFNYDLVALAAVLVWKLCERRPGEAPSALHLFAWLVPTLMMSVPMPGAAPVALVAMFAMAVREAAAEGNGITSWPSLGLTRGSARPSRVAEGASSP